MRVIERALNGVLLLEPTVYQDARGSFFESFNARQWQALTGHAPLFVQDNQSYSRRGVLRGLHYQIRQAQGKLVRCLSGAIYDVCVDLRRASPTFGQWCGWELSADNRRMVWLPEGFAHGFLVLSDQADCLYKTTDYWAPDAERTLAWNDPALAISWPMSSSPILSEKDKMGLPLNQAELFD